MMRNKLLNLLLMMLPLAGFPQTTPGKSPAVVIVTGRPMTVVDSEMVNQLFFSALREKTVENLGLAAEEFNRVIEIDPRNDASMYELSILRKNKNDYDDARTLLERAVTVNPDNEWYWVALADCYEKNNEIAKLENVFNELIRINPDKADYYFDKANALYILKRYDDALAVYDQAEKITGVTDDILANRQKIYLKQGKVDLAAQQLEQIIASNPSEIKYYLFLAQLYSANNIPDKALKVLLAAEKLNAGNGLVHLALADIYRDKKDYDNSYNELTLAFAIPALDINQKIKIVLGYLPRLSDPNVKASALELSRVITVAHPSDSRGFALYGDMLLQNNKIKEAREAYKKSIALNNQVYEVQEQLVRIEVGNNDPDAAIADGENSLSFFPNQAWMNYLVGLAWQQKKDYNKALGYFKNATALEATDKELLSQCYSSLGDCYHSLKDFKNSNSAYDKALTYNPDNAFTLNNYAYYLSVRGEELDKAASMSKHSNELQAANASFEDTYAWILFKQKDYTGAKLWIDKALKDDKSQSSTKLEHYGDIVFYLGNTDEAVASWKKAKASGDQSALLDRKINERKYIE